LRFAARVVLFFPLRPPRADFLFAIVFSSEFLQKCQHPTSHCSMLAPFRARLSYALARFRTTRSDALLALCVAPVFACSKNPRASRSDKAAHSG
jgi:hypothetical protein